MTESGTSTRHARAATKAIALPALLLTLLTFALNGNALTAFFVGDDFDFLRGMEHLDSLADTAAFSFWGEWEPVWWTSWYVDFALWGARPLGFHLTNVLWLAVCVVCLFGLVRTAWPEATIAPWAAALFFATHPIHDEAVTYLAARGHPMATGLMLAALWAFARLKTSGGSRRLRTSLWAAAVLGAFLSALAKETALVLPVWAGALAFALADAGVVVRLRRAATTTALFAIPAAATLALRGAIVGLESDKLTGGLYDPAALVAAVFADLPNYALLAGLPLPFAFASLVHLETWQWLGWGILLLAALGSIVIALRSAGGDRRASTAFQLWGLGWVMFVTGLGPVLWADLGLRRRYAFSPSVGAVLIACAVLLYLHARAPRAARLALVLLVLMGAGATWQRNALYQRSGELAESVLTTLRGAPLEQPGLDGPGEAALLTLPRAYGGDSVSGAYLFHHTDLTSGLRFYDAAARRIHYALKTYYADDYSAEAHFEGPHELRLTVSFRKRRAFDDASARDPSEDRFGDLLYAELESADAGALTLDYRVYLRPGFWERAGLYVFSDRGLTRLSPPDEGPTDLSTFGAESP